MSMALTRPSTDILLAFAPIPDAVRAARHALRERGLSPDLDHTVSLLTTEVVANAVKHAGVEGGEIRVAATFAPDFCRVEVLDAGPGFDPEAVAGKGLGLRLVDKLATRWGVETARGTLVWFEVDRRRRRFSR
jgi:anti-sigma regulatory factor (Ser/Thr protein kinase)